MTEIERYTGPNRHLGAIELAPEAWTLAQKIANTDFVPGAMRGKPEAVLAAMLTGHEAGIGPMASLAKIHVVDGRPGMAAELMRAIVLRDGHEFWIEESSSTKVTVGGKRKGSERETRVTWTLDDGRQANLLNKSNWKTYPRAMLLARATAELCRAIFPDVLAGISYTVEELADGDVLELEIPADLTDEGRAVAGAAKKATKKTAKAKNAATRGASSAGSPDAPPAPPPEREEAPLDGEDDAADLTAPKMRTASSAPVDDDEIEDAVLVETFPAGEGDDQRIEGSSSGASYTGPQIIAIRLGELDVTDRDEKLRIVGAILNRKVGTTKDLERADVEEVLTTLERYKARETGFVFEDLRAELAAEAAIEAEETLEHELETSVAEIGRPTLESWDEGAWRAFTSGAGVKVTELLREAQRLAREDGDKGPGTLGELASPETGASLKALLVGFVEDLAAQRATT